MRWQGAVFALLVAFLVLTTPASASVQLPTVTPADYDTGPTVAIANGVMQQQSTPALNLSLEQTNLSLINSVTVKAPSLQAHIDIPPAVRSHSLLADENLLTTQEKLPAYSARTAQRGVRLTSGNSSFLPMTEGEFAALGVQEDRLDIITTEDEYTAGDTITIVRRLLHYDDAEYMHEWLYLFKGSDAYYLSPEGGWLRYFEDNGQSEVNYYLQASDLLASFPSGGEFFLYSLFISDDDGSVIAAESNTFTLVPSNEMTLSGRIVDTEGNPLGDAVAKLKTCSGELVDSDGVGSNGEFTLRAEAGNYRFVITYSGVDYNLKVNGEDCPYYSATDHEFNSDLVIRTDFSLSGMLNDEFGNAVSGATARFTDCSGNAVASTTTDGGGNFRLSAHIGSYKLKFDYNGYTYDRPVDGEACKFYLPIDYSFNSPVAIEVFSKFSGKVKDEVGGGYISGAVVELASCDGSILDSDTTGSDGSFSVKALAGEHNLLIKYAGSTYETGCGARGPGSYNLGDVLISARTVVEGMITDDLDEPIQGLVVKLTTCSDEPVDDDTTDSNGKFRLEAAPGDYKFKVNAGAGDVTVPINGKECNAYPAAVIKIDASIVTHTRLSGRVVDEEGEPLEELTAKLVSCDNSNFASSKTNSNGEFEIVAEPGDYKLQVVTWYTVFNLLIDGNLCNAYSAGKISFDNDIEIPRYIQLSGTLQDLNNNPLPGYPVQLHTCSDQFITEELTQEDGSFYVKSIAGPYKAQIVLEGGMRLKFVDVNKNDCILLAGTVDTGTINVNPYPDCSVFNYICYEGKKLHSCFFDKQESVCKCYVSECPDGCTDGDVQCDQKQYGTVKIDVDNVDDSFKPVKGARVSADSGQEFTTGSDGKIEVSLEYGYRDLHVVCPNTNDCGTKTIYVDGTEYEYFDCSCGVEYGTLQVNVNDDYSRPAANVYAAIDGNYQDVELTNPFGFVNFEGVKYGEHAIELFFKATEAEQGYYTKTASVVIDESREVVVLSVSVTPSSQAAGVGDSNVVKSSPTVRVLAEDANPEALPVIIAVAAIGIVQIGSIAYSAEELCRCMYEGNDFSLTQLCIAKCGGENAQQCAEVARGAGNENPSCWVETTFLTADLASPGIPAGTGLHGAVWVGRVAKVDDGITFLSKFTGDAVTYLKDGLTKIAKWTGSGFKRITKIDSIPGITSWEDDAIEAVNKFVDEAGDKALAPQARKKAAQQAAERIGKEMSEEEAKKLFLAIDKLKKAGIDGAEELSDDVAKAAKNLDDKIAAKASQKSINGARADFMGKVAEAQLLGSDKYIPKLAKVRVRDTLKSGNQIEIDGLLKNGDIVEVKNFNWNNPAAVTENVDTLKRQIRNFDTFQREAKQGDKITGLLKKRGDKVPDDLVKMIEQERTRLKKTIEYEVME